MLSFLVSEVAFFSTLIVVYRAYLGAEQSGPTPAVLSLPLVIGTTFCLLTSSVTVHHAANSLKAWGRAFDVFIRWWSATILLGMIFLAGTAWEWPTELVVVHGLTPGRNLFGTTYYTLVGFHALHVTMGVVAMLTVLGLALSVGRQRRHEKPGRRRTDFLVLALRRCRLGRGLRSGLRRRAIADSGRIAARNPNTRESTMDNFRMTRLPSLTRFRSERQTLEMPRPTIAPLMLALGMVLLAAGARPLAWCSWW